VIVWRDQTYRSLRGRPAWAAILLCLALVCVLLLGLSFAVLAGLGQLATLLPTYATQAQAQVPSDLTDALVSFASGTPARGWLQIDVAGDCPDCVVNFVIQSMFSRSE
jgi:predicted PurR-regulated permease PerM